MFVDLVSLSLELFVYVCACVCVCANVYMCICERASVLKWEEIAFRISQRIQKIYPASEVGLCALHHHKL